MSIHLNKTQKILLMVLSLFIICLISLAGMFLKARTVQTHHPIAELQKIKGHADAGKQIYQRFCSTCHADHPTIPLGAPRLHDKANWAVRQKKGMAGMLHLTAVGFNRMPPRGGCFECDDELLKEAIEYMLQEAR